MSDAWYYAHDGESIGPLNVDELGNALRCFDRPRDISVWRKGMGDWARAGALPELIALFDAPPPPPARSIPEMNAPVLPGPERRDAFVAPVAEIKARVTEDKKQGLVSKFSGWAVTIFAAVVGIAIGKAFLLVDSHGTNRIMRRHSGSLTTCYPKADILTETALARLANNRHSRVP